MKSKNLSDSNEYEDGVQSGKVHKAKNSSNQKKVLETAEMKGYLNKLQEMVPLMPKNKRLSKVEVISYAIDYIRDLRQTLGMSPCEDADMFEDCQSLEAVTDPVSIKLSVVNNETNQVPSPSHLRQPLSDISSPSNTVPGLSDDSFSLTQDVSKSISAM